MTKAELTLLAIQKLLKEIPETEYNDEPHDGGNFDDTYQDGISYGRYDLAQDILALI